MGLFGLKNGDIVVSKQGYFSQKRQRGGVAKKRGCFGPKRGCFGHSWGKPVPRGWWVPNAGTDVCGERQHQEVGIGAAGGDVETCLLLPPALRQLLPAVRPAGEPRRDHQVGARVGGRRRLPGGAEEEEAGHRLPPLPRRWERLAEECRQHGELLRGAHARGLPPPQHRYEKRTVGVLKYGTGYRGGYGGGYRGLAGADGSSVRRSFPELSGSDLALSVVRGINLPAPAGERQHRHLRGGRQASGTAR